MQGSFPTCETRQQVQRPGGAATRQVGNRAGSLVHTGTTEEGPRHIDVRIFRSIDNTAVTATGKLGCADVDAVEGTDRGLLNRCNNTVVVIKPKVRANNIGNAIFSLVTGRGRSITTTERLNSPQREIKSCT